MSRTRFIAAALVLLLAALALRTVWLRSDPPVSQSVGVVWHDEGAWVHNARNRALWGTWRTDAWNPVFVAPVFTALEYLSFRELGVGLWQARVVPVASGIVTILSIIFGLGRIAGPRTALVGAALLATNYVFVMWNRAALMESTMTAALAASWAAYAWADRRAFWGVVAGIAATLAWFTKAAAAFFIAAIVLDAIVRAARPGADRRAAVATLGGLAGAAIVIGAMFVLPYWNEYQFYNWQMSVTRKPDYAVRAFVDRATWLPLVHDIFTRMWLVLVPAAVFAVGTIMRWWKAHPAERLLVLWIVVGLAELIVHDSGNERRYVMLIPAIAALGALTLRLDTAQGPGLRAHADTAHGPRLMAHATTIAAVVVGLLFAYLVAASALRPFFIESVAAGEFRTIVRLSAAIAVGLTLAAVWAWRRGAATVINELFRARAVAATILIVTISGDVWSYGQWLRERDNENYDASVALGEVLPAGTPVQGKLANGMALENRIKPVFVGNGFGNYDDRLSRSSPRYILTYDLPRVGYESSDGSGLIQGILDEFPGYRLVRTFPVDETPGPDRAALIDKFPGIALHARD